MEKQNLGKLNIIVAIYGLKTVTDLIANLIINGKPETLSFMVDNLTIGDDGWRGQRKSLFILYNYDEGDLEVAVAKEGHILSVSPNKVQKPKPISI